MIQYDPGLAALCSEVFRDTEFVYTRPITRLSGHMAQYDPAKAPMFVWPEQLRAPVGAIVGKALERGKPQDMQVNLSAVSTTTIAVTSTAEATDDHH